MKKVLIVGYLNRPRRGSYRIEGLAKYLPDFGWEPIILTALPDEKPAPGLRVIETPYSDVLDFWRRLFRLDPNESVRRQVKKRFGIRSEKSLVDTFLNFCGALAGYPDLDKGWKPFALKAGNELLQKEKMDVMISIGPPVTSYLIAKELKARYGVPWVADLVDLWSQNHDYPFGPLRRLLDRRLELKTFSQADALVTVSQPWAQKLATLHRGKQVYAISRGFDPAEVNMPPVKVTTEFTVTYTGSIYPGKQDPSKLLAAVRNLISARIMDPNRVKIRFYGPREGWLDREFEEYSLSGIAEQYGRVSRQVALEKQWESQILLLLKWEDLQEQGVYPGKTFEYLAARRPILATGGWDDGVKELLDETKAGIDAPTVKHIESILKQLYQEYELKGKIAYKGEESEISKHSYREVARKVSEILNCLT